MTALGPLVSTDWLAERLGDPTVKIIDASWRMPGEPPAIDDYRKRHIPGAAFFDIDAIAAKNTDLPHMLPLVSDFEKAAGALGVSDQDRVVFYDDQGLFSAARVWWTFRAMGHEHAAALDGGLPKWRAENRPLSTAPPAIARASYRAAPKPDFCKSAGDIRAALTGDVNIIDARPADRFAGKAPEPRAGLRSGAMPGALNVPFASLLREDQTMRSADEITALFRTAGADLAKPAITTCGSGVTAAILFLALEIIGHHTHGLYDGSWAEWGDERNDSREFPVVAEA